MRRGRQAVLMTKTTSNTTTAAHYVTIHRPSFVRYSAVHGTGVRHSCARKPVDGLVVEALKDFPGVQSKRKGRQVVAAGSIHPETEKHYVWKDGAPTEMPEFPANLLRMITRPQRSAVTSGG